ncbi:MAG: ATP-binding protein [Bacteroidota bacterium]
MELKELKKVCEKGENQFVEFKKKANHPDQILEEIVGFANAHGGNIFVGVDDNGLTHGVKFAGDDVTFLRDEIQKRINPKPDYEMGLIPVNKKKSIINIKIKPGLEKPYALSYQETKKVFYRTDDLCIQASRELRNILKISRHEKGQKIIYSDVEGEILKIIDTRERITKAQIVEMINYKSRQISDCLVRLVAAGVLKIIPSVGNDFYEYP